MKKQDVGYRPRFVISGPGVVSIDPGTVVNSSSAIAQKDALKSYMEDSQQKAQKSTAK